MLVPPRWARRICVLFLAALALVVCALLQNSFNLSGSLGLTDDDEVTAVGTWLMLEGVARRLTLESKASGRHWHIWTLVGVGLLVPSIAILRNIRCYIYITVVRKSTAPSAPENPLRNRDELHVLVAAIEHTIPDKGVKVSAGGLGKVLDQMLKEHPPGELSLVHPMFGDVDYGDNLEEFDVIYCVIDSRQVEVTIRTLSSEHNGIRRKWYLLDNELFRSQPSATPYPAPMTRIRTLKYLSLWNQAVAELLALLQPDIYHCMDYHAALAPLYLPEHKQVPMILVLHNADYMGSIETDFISDKFWKTVKQLRRLTLLFNLSEQTVRDYLDFEGRFNMLKAGVQYIMDTQGGRGICAVSADYAKELKRERPLFSYAPTILALDNATDPSADSLTHLSLPELKAMKSQAKMALQKACELNVSDRYRILVFIGRWVKQKGVDQIALLTPTILRAHPDIQMVFAGPPGDSHGMYAQELLEPMVDEFPGRLFVKTTFFKMTSEMKAGADFCFAPSISEPFGYVDVEFGLVGVPTIGCAVGGLSKMPGVYYRQQNSDSNEALLQSFYSAIEFGLALPEDEYWDMAQEGIKAVFPFETWRENLREAYTQALTKFEPNLGQSIINVGALLARGSQLMSSVVGGAVQSKSDNNIGEVTDVVTDMRRMDIFDGEEFLSQDVSEQRTHTILRRSITRAGGDRKDAAAISFYIFQADQRQHESNNMTLWLMKPFKPLASKGRCIRIHAVVALGFIFFPVGLSTMYDALGTIDNTATRSYLQQVFYFGLCIGSLIWIGLSKGIPPNMLMGLSQFLNVILIFLTYSGLPEWSLFPIHFFFGFQSASRLLFAIWNFGEDFQGGFETITKRIALWESLRICADGLLVFIASSGLPLLSNLIRVVISLTVLSLMIAAPRAYSTFVLPRLGWLEGILPHTAYWLLLLSQAFFYLAWAPGLSTLTWWSFGSWSVSDSNLLILCASVLTCVAVFGIFMTIHSLTVWGPWPMRDFVCTVPPGSLLGALVVYILGNESRNSFTLAITLFVCTVLDAARTIAMFSSMLTIVGSKWYALKGGFISFMVTSACTCLAPFITSWIASVIRGGDAFEPVEPSEMVENPVIVFCAVVPFTLLSYLFQLIALPFFNEDILTYKGHGMYLPDGRPSPIPATHHRLNVSIVAEAQQAHDLPLDITRALSRADSTWVLASDTQPVPDTGSQSLPMQSHVQLPIGAVGADQQVGQSSTVPPVAGGQLYRLAEERGTARAVAFYQTDGRQDSNLSSVTRDSRRSSNASSGSMPTHVAREAQARAPDVQAMRRKHVGKFKDDDVPMRSRRGGMSVRTSLFKFGSSRRSSKKGFGGTGSRSWSSSSGQLCV